MLYYATGNLCQRNDLGTLGEKRRATSDVMFDNYRKGKSFRVIITTVNYNFRRLKTGRLKVDALIVDA
jgi:hypothetical protein